MINYTYSYENKDNIRSQVEKTEYNLYRALINSSNSKVFWETARNKQKQVLANFVDEMSPNLETNNLGVITETLLVYGNGICEKTNGVEMEIELNVDTLTYNYMLEPIQTFVNTITEFTVNCQEGEIDLTNYADDNHTPLNLLN